MKALKISILFVCLMAFMPDVMAQCAMCRGTVESTVSNGRSVVASDLNIGILYLLLIPYLLVGSIAYIWYRNSRKEFAKRLELTRRVKQAYL